MEAKAKDEEKKNKRKRGYDIIGNKNKVLERIQTDLVRSTENSMQKAREECASSLKEYEEKYAPGAESHFFVGYVNIVRARQSLAEAMTATEASSADALKGVVDSQVQSKLLAEDDAVLIELLSDAAANLTREVEAAEGEDDIKKATKNLKEAVGRNKRIHTSVLRAASDLKKAMTQKQKKAEAEISKKRKQEEAQQKKDVKEMQKRTKQAQGGAGALPGLWVEGPLRSSLCADLPVYDDLANVQRDLKAGGCLHHGEPYIISAKGVAGTMNEELNKESVKGFMQIFETQFPLSKQAREKGRAQSAVKVDGIGKLREALMSFVSAKCKAFKGDGNGLNSDLEHLSAYGFSSAMRYAGAEYLGMSSIRYSMKGEREVVLCNASDVWPVIRDSHSDEVGKLSGDRVVTSFLGDKLMQASLEDSWVQALMKEAKENGDKKVMFRGIVPEGSVFVVPAGVILMERSLNQKLALGLRLALQDTSKSSMRNLEILLGVHSTYADAADKLAKRWSDVLSHGKQNPEPAT